MADENRFIDPAVLKALDGLPSDFDGFADVFETKLRPELMALETKRKAAAGKAKKGWVIAAAIAAVSLAAGFLVLPEPMFGVIGAGLSALIGVFMGADLHKIGKRARSMMVLPIAREFGLTFTEDPGPQASIHDFRQAKLLPGWDREAYEDRLTGTRHGVDFEFFEAHLEDRRTRTDSKGRTRTEWVTVFRGQCLRFNYHKDFLGRTRVARDAGFLDRFGGGDGMKLAKLEDPVFEKAFSVYTTDQVEARYILTPDVMQRFVDLEQAFRGGKLRCAFEYGEVLVCVEGGDLFEPGSLFKPLDNPDRIRELLDDFAAVFHLMDAISPPSKHT